MIPKDVAGIAQVLAANIHGESWGYTCHTLPHFRCHQDTVRLSKSLIGEIVHCCPVVMFLGVPILAKDSKPLKETVLHCRNT